MFCTKCGQMLNNDGLCTNENCPSKTTSFNETSVNNSPQNNNMNTSTSNQPYMNSPYSNQTYSNNQYGYRNQYGNEEEAQDFMLFVGEKNTEYYMEKYTRYQQNAGFASWNWPAFFLNFYWLLYRKMYGYAAGYFGIQFAISLLSGVFAPLLSLAMYILVGIFANQIYIKFSLNKIRSLKYAIPGMSEEDIKRRITFNGGTNLVAPLVIAGIMLLFLILVIVIIFIGFAAYSRSPWLY
ncbi:MAG: DUF2628 domain-containing protein [Clostridium sp.]